MPTLPANLKLYLRLAIDRRQILARRMAARICAAVLAALVLLAGIGLLNIALFLILRPLLGDLWSVLAVALLHFLVGGTLTYFALSELASAELTALGNAEAAALDALDSEAHAKLASIGAGLSISANALPSLIGLFKGPSHPATPMPAEGAVKVPDDKA